MADDSRELEIKILTKYFGAGAAQAIIDQDKLAAGTKDLGTKTAEATDAAKEHVKHLEGGRLVFNQLNRVVPELGHALHAAFMGPLGPLILLGLAIGEVKHKLGEYNEELDKVGEEEIAKHAEAVADLATVWANAQISLGKYQAALMHAGEDNDPIATAIKREKELEAARMEGSKRLIEQLGKEEEAAIRRNGALNFEESEVTNKKLQAAREATQDKLKAVDQQKDSPTVPLLQVEFSRRTEQRDQLAKREEDAERAAFEAGEKFDKHQKELTDLRKQKDDAFEKANKNMEQANSMMEGIDAENNIDYTAIKKSAVDQASEELKRATTERDNVIKRQKQLEAGMAPEAKARAEADKKLEDARAANIENQKRIMQLPGEITQEQSKDALRRNPNANVPSPLSQLDAVPTIAAPQGRTPFAQTPEGKARFDWSQLEGAYDVLRSGGHLDQRQEALIQSILNAITGQKAKADKFVEVMEKINADNKSRDAAFERLASEVARVRVATDLH